MLGPSGVLIHAVKITRGKVRKKNFRIDRIADISLAFIIAVWVEALLATTLRGIA